MSYDEQPEPGALDAVCDCHADNMPTPAEFAKALTKNTGVNTVVHIPEGSLLLMLGGAFKVITARPKYLVIEPSREKPPTETMKKGQRLSLFTGMFYVAGIGNKCVRLNAEPKTKVNPRPLQPR